MSETTQCTYTAWGVNSYRQCELPEGHDGPHGCTHKGEEWITLWRDNEKP